MKDFFFTLAPERIQYEIAVGANGHSPLRNTDIQIYNVYGEKIAVGVHCNVPLRIDVSTFPVGIYFLRIGNEIQNFVVMR
ncbi:MAG: T9SS type A sorting domain-containing protein [bacterium]